MFLENFDLVFSYIELCFPYQSSRLREIGDKINTTIVLIYCVTLSSIQSNLKILYL